MGIAWVQQGTLVTACSRRELSEEDRQLVPTSAGLSRISATVDLCGLFVKVWRLRSQARSCAEMYWSSVLQVCNR